MSPFLDQLDRQLADAATRIVKGERHRRPVPALVPAVVVVAIVAVFIAVLGLKQEATERAVGPTPAAPVTYSLPGPPPALRDVPIHLVGSSTAAFSAVGIDVELRNAGWMSRFERKTTVRARIENMVVVAGTAGLAKAELVAETLGVDEVATTNSAFPELRDYPLSLVIGDSPRFGPAVEAYRKRFSALGPDGDATIETALGPARLNVRGGSLCVVFNGGGGCSDFESAVRGENIVTYPGDQQRRVIGVVPDGITYVVLGSDRVPVEDNLWVHGSPQDGSVEIPGIGTVDF